MPNGLIRQIFQSTLPVRGATGGIPVFYDIKVFQSTLPVRGATIMAIKITRVFRFQSTLPVRGATPRSAGWWSATYDFNPRSP